MKALKQILSVIGYSITIFSLTSCLESQYNEIKSNTIQDGFEFSTTNEYNVSIQALNNSNEPITGVYIELYTQDPLEVNGTKKADSESYLIYKGVTKSDGKLECAIRPSSAVENLSVLVHQIGLETYHSVNLDSKDITLVVGGTTSTQQNVMAKVSSSTSTALTKPSWNKTHEFLVLGSWNKSGKVNYLTKDDDIISSDFLADINSSLPDQIELSQSHPEYLNSEDDGSLVLVEDAEVWVTFVHAGVGNLNSLAYYTYPNGTTQLNVSQVVNPVIIFPNISYASSGGTLTSGNKVQLLYYNEDISGYSTIFPKGTTVAWVLRSNGWDSSLKDVNTGDNTFYSQKLYNPESAASKKKHSVVLKDDLRELFLIGFEDLNREEDSDDDFNDVVVFATVSPYTAVQSTKYESIESNKDSDDDGVSDTDDEYPSDANKAFNNYYPAKNVEGTLAFEDLWPYKGDYDFNDLIVDYNFNQITNAQNEVTAVEATLTVRAIGASFKNGFGIQFNTSPENVRSVSGQKITEDFLQLASNGTENAQENAVVFAFDNAFSVLPHPGGMATLNTTIGLAYQTPGIINLNIEFINPVDYSQFGTPPYNPFIVIDGQRGKEVHLPATIPTSLVDLSLLGMGDDNSDPSIGKYYMSDKYLPWAVNFPVKFDYPAEKQDITKAYLNFNSWAASSGYNNMDWYLNNNGYRNSSLIYSK
ncbi:MAG: LruC domain-containing protein [Paludibacter sp.]|nr:LruC domain-containing protein [Paludibacter sp.]